MDPRSMDNLKDHPVPWTTPYFQKQIAPVSVNVRLGTWYRTYTYGTQYPVPAFLYVIEAFASYDGPAGACEILVFSSWILLDIIF